VTGHEADCALALDRLRMHTRHVLKRPSRAFVADMAHRASLVLAGRWTPPLTSRQSQWLLELVLLHAKSLRNDQLVTGTRLLLGRQAAA
jgi:hypothetical protein